METLYLQSTPIAWFSKEILSLLLPLAMAMSGLFIFSLRKKKEGAINLSLFVFGLLITLLSLSVVYQGFKQPFGATIEWFDFGKKIEISYGLDHVGTLMVSLVVFVTLLVTLYSTSYLKGEGGYARYFTSLFLFAASMLGIILSFNLLLTFVFWELVGFCSYLLINFWYQRPASNEAARKAFIVNRIGDLGFVFGLGLLYAQFGTFELAEIKASIALGRADSTMLFLSGLGLFVGCMGKSAQFPLLVWLPDAMQAPTPVSALLHAATMVAAGVFLMARILPVLSSDVLIIVAYAGAVTSFIGAFSAACQTDIKKILAYSTISQLGYMMVGLGAHSPFASLFHLFTHAMFKASLFLAAGAIIHAVAHLKEQKLKNGTQGSDFDPQDIRFMGGLRKRMPFTFLAFLLASMAGAGVPLTAGFLSKDEILAAACAWASVQSGWVYWILPILVFCTSFMTAFYLGRMVFLLFFGGFRLGKYFPEYKGTSQHLHEASWLMLLPYCVLSLLSLFVFFSFNPIDPDKSWLVSFLPMESSAYGLESSFLALLHQKQEVFHYPVIAISFVVLSAGFGLSYILYGFRTRYKIDFLKIGLPHNWLVSLSANGFYLNSLYSVIFVRPFEQLSGYLSAVERKGLNACVENVGIWTVALSHGLAWMDRFFVDGLVNLGVLLISQSGRQLGYLQNGKVQTYLVLGMAVMVGAMLWLLI
jgi:NADH-quinone oxidoreductase subunit L